MSGKNPGGHGIYGFIDREPETLRLMLPNAANRHGKTVWNRLGDAGISSIVINIPVTYPPECIRGVLVSGFLGVSLEKSVYPRTRIEDLKRFGYIIDAETGDAMSRPELFMEHLEDIIERRFDLFEHLLSAEPWRFAHLHIMETDRLFHFMWDHVMDDNSPCAGAVRSLFHRIDRRVHAIAEFLSDDDEMILMSDHGFCRASHMFDLNQWLEDNGWLRRSANPRKGCINMAPESRAYSLLPGRIYLNRSGREPEGSVSLSESDSVLSRLMNALKNVTIPGTDTPLFAGIFRGDALFSGDCIDRAPDLVAVPVRGVELKARMETGPLFQPSRLTGMHTPDDALVWFKNGVPDRSDPGIIDMCPAILDFFGLHDGTLEGRQFVHW